MMEATLWNVVWTTLALVVPGIVGVLVLVLAERDRG